MIWLLGGYMWLFIHRPFEVWPSLGGLHIERFYMLLTVLWWGVSADRQWISNRLSVAFAFFWLVVLVSWMFSPFAAAGSQTVEDYFKITVFYLLVITTVRDERDLKLLVMMFLGAMSLYMAHSLWEYHHGRRVFRMGTDRMVGVDVTCGDPNNFAASVVCSLPMLYPAWALAQRLWMRWAIAGYAMLAAVCVLLTGSRMGFVGLCMLILIGILSSKHRLAILLASVIVAPMAFAMLPEDRQNRFLTIVDPSYGPENAQESAESRWEGWHHGVLFWRERPILGVGPGAFVEARKVIGTRGSQAHHLYGQVIGELGSAGAVAFAAVVFGFLANGLALRRACREPPELWNSFPARLIIAITVAVVLLLLMGLAGHFLYRYNWLWFGAFEVIALVCLRRCEIEGSLAGTETDLMASAEAS